MIHSFLLIGQSNAAGRGFFSEAAPLDTCEGKLKVLRNGRWFEMYRPVNPDRSFSGTCLAESFAKAYFEAHPNVEVGIIPCADGGTTIEQWLPGEVLFDNAVNNAKLAMRSSVIKGVIWHQGEGDCIPERYTCYSERFKIVMDALRSELNLPELPILVGGLGDFLSQCTLSENMKNYPYVNEQLQKVANEYPYCGFVTAEGLGANPDNLHFCASALDEFGIRYFKEYEKHFFGKNTCEEQQMTENKKMSEMELL